MKTCLSILLVALCACWADLPKLSSQEAELLKSIEQLPPEQAVRALEGKLPENASSAMLFSLGTLYYKANRLEQARKSFLQAVELAPDFDTARLNAVKVMMREQLHREAIPHLVRLLSTKADAELWLLLAQCRLCLREYLAAEKAASAAIALKPEEKEAQLILLQALASQPGRLAEASTLARQLLNSTPNDSRLWSIWASAELEAAERVWHAAEHFTHVFLRHPELDGISDAFFTLRQGLDAGDGIELAAAYDLLRYHLECVDRMEHVSPGSVF